MTRTSCQRHFELARNPCAKRDRPQAGAKNELGASTFGGMRFAQGYRSTTPRCIPSVDMTMTAV
jgi:hypothetical protein